jgi:hypothetical protein
MLVKYKEYVNKQAGYKMHKTIGEILASEHKNCIWCTIPSWYML